MIKNIYKLGMGRIYLFSFILLCSVFTGENAFSIHWYRDFVGVHYDNNSNSIIFNFLFHHYRDPYNHAYLSSFNFSYSENGEHFTKLISVLTRNQNENDLLSISIHHKKKGENIKLFNLVDNAWINLSDGRDLSYYVRALKHVHPNAVTDRLAYLCFKWDLSGTGRSINSIRVDGLWYNGEISQVDKIKEVYPLDTKKSNNITMENAPSELNSEISDKVNVAGENDAINLTGAEPGENIKIYTISGLEIKSVVANDDVVNIKLPKNQIYIVKAGQSHYKVAL